MIYVPEVENGNCVVIQNSETIRVYETTPTQNSSVNYKDYYPKLNYAYNTGTQNFGLMTTIPSCREATTNIMDRPDININIGIVTIILLIGIYCIYNLLKDMFDKKEGI